eukprot:10168972-Prorocentrum_lima.AAC.1
MGLLYAQTPDTGGLREVPVFSEHWYTSTAQMSTTQHTTTGTGSSFQSATQPHELLHHSE